MLPDERERVGEQIERDGQTAARRAHHRLVVFERVAMLVEDGHVLERAYFFGGFDGRSSMRLGEAARRRCRSRSSDHVGDVLRRDLPVGALRLVAARESGRDRAGHHVAHADVVVAAPPASALR